MLDRANVRAYWLPVDAEPNSDANWISSAMLTDHLNRMAAHHVLVVADSYPVNGIVSTPCLENRQTRAAQPP